MKDWITPGPVDWRHEKLDFAYVKDTVEIHDYLDKGGFGLEYSSGLTPGIAADELATQRIACLWNEAVVSGERKAPPRHRTRMRLAILRLRTRGGSGEVCVESLLLRGRSLRVRMCPKVGLPADPEVLVVGGSYMGADGHAYGRSPTLKLTLSARAHAHRLVLPAGVRTQDYHLGKSATDSNIFVGRADAIEYVIYPEGNNLKTMANSLGPSQDVQDLPETIAMTLWPVNQDAKALKLIGTWDGDNAPESLTMGLEELWFSWKGGACFEACPEASLAKKGYTCIIKSGPGGADGRCEYYCHHDRKAGGRGSVSLPATVTFSFKGEGPRWSTEIEAVGALVGGPDTGDDRVQILHDDPPLTSKSIAIAPPIRTKRIKRKEQRRATSLASFPALVIQGHEGSSFRHDLKLKDDGVSSPTTSPWSDKWIGVQKRTCGQEITYTYIDEIRQYDADTVRIGRGFMVKVAEPHQLMKRFGVVVGIGGGLSGSWAPKADQYNGHLRVDLGFSWWPDLMRRPDERPKSDSGEVIHPGYRWAFEFGIHWLHGGRKFLTADVAPGGLFDEEFMPAAEARTLRYNRFIFDTSAVIRVGRGRRFALDVGPNIGLGFAHFTSGRRVVPGVQLLWGGSLGLRAFDVPYGVISLSSRVLAEPVIRYQTSGLGRPGAREVLAPTVLVDLALRFDITKIPFLSSAFGRQVRRLSSSY